MSGIFIVFEGPEGSGKTTQARRLATRVSAQGRDVVLTREPGGTPIGEQVRTILLDQTNCAMLPETEALLYSAARAQHVGDVIRPALERGAVVICDRFADSTLAYQGGGRGLSMDDLRAIQRLATGGLTPTLRILVDLPVEVGLRRRFGVEDEVNRLDVAGIEFHRRVRSAYLEMAALDQSWIVIDGDDSVDVVEERIVQTVARKTGLALAASA
ncbi:MAG: dTMP kinase [Thermomicrobiales bacterium]|nr:dTMP kinase [Thermomicrobiales bacterium]MEA2594557.1 dTMP kinase [Thermomicrobiales bacterium]